MAVNSVFISMLVVMLLEAIFIVMIGNNFSGGIKGLMGFIFAKRIVWKIYPDGTMKPFSAKATDLAYTIGDKEYYDYKKNDIVTFARKPGILVYAPYNRGLSPDAVAQISMFKKLKIRDYHTFKSILDAKLMTREEYNRAIKAQYGGDSDE